MTIRYEDWSEEQDAWLKEKCKTALSYTGLANEYALTFSPPRSRNAILGKAMRMGYRDFKPRARGGVRVVRASVTRTGRIKASKALVPVTFKDPASLRDDNEPLVRRSGPYAMRKTPAQIAEARKGKRVSIIEDKPLTSRPMFETSDESCKWPTSEDISCMEVCGAEATHGAYCERHARVAYVEMPTMKRNQSYARKGMIDTARKVSGDDAQWIADQLIDDEVTIAPTEHKLLEFVPGTGRPFNGHKR